MEFAAEYLNSVLATHCPDTLLLLPQHCYKHVTSIFTSTCKCLQGTSKPLNSYSTRMHLLIFNYSTTNFSWSSSPCDLVIGRRGDSLAAVPRDELSWVLTNSNIWDYIISSEDWPLILFVMSTICIFWRRWSFLLSYFVKCISILTSVFYFKTPLVFIGPKYPLYSIISLTIVYKALFSIW